MVALKLGDAHTDGAPVLDEHLSAAPSQGVYP